jgi:hypothetical protein
VTVDTTKLGAAIEAARAGTKTIREFNLPAEPALIASGQDIPIQRDADS